MAPLVFGCMGLGILLWLGAMAWQRHPLFEEIWRGLAMLSAKLTSRENDLPEHRERVSPD